MRYFVATLALIALLAAAGGFAAYRAHCDPAAHAAARAGDTMEWMRCEFHLSNDQYAAIVRLHEEHAAVCVGHCAAVNAARARLAEARHAADSAAGAAATAALHAAEATCRDSVEAHVRRVAAVMAPAQGERYLAMVLPKIAAIDHSGPPGLTLDR